MATRREQLVEMRKALFPRLERMRKLGDYAAGAADTRETAETLIKVIDLLLETAR